MPIRAFNRLGAGSPTARLALAAALVWLAIAMAAGFLLLRERTATIERASRNLSALALVLEGHTARTFQAVDLTLAGAVDALRLADDLPPHDPEFQQALEERLEYLTPYVRAIYIVDAEGRVIHHTDYPASPAITPAAREYFQRHRLHPTLVAAIAEPLENNPGLGWFVPVTRRLGTGTEFEGVAVAAVQPRYFDALYRRMGLGVTDYISLFYENGILISQYPNAGRTAGASFANASLFEHYLPRNDTGTYITLDPVLPFERLVSYRAVRSHPLVVSVSQQMSAVLAPWRAMATGAAIALAALLLLLALLVEQFRRQQRAHERVQEQHAKTERMQALGHLTSGIAHDFNNLLGVISSSLAVVAHEGGGEVRSDAIAAAERAVGRGAELIRRLSTFARSRPMEVTTARLDECVRACEQLLIRAAGRHIELLLDLHGDLPPCRLDETELEVALVNLVVNARDAMAGSGRIAIRTYFCPDADDRVCVSVEDGGHGMSHAVQQHAFEPYWTTKGDGGTGLGLAQVYGFMLQVGGEARIESRPGIGTKVELLFPIA